VVPSVPPLDRYSLRLVALRRLYDHGVLTEACDGLRALAPGAVVRANPFEFERLGVSTGDRVRVRSARGELVLPAAADDGVPRGVASIDFNLPEGGGYGGQNGQPPRPDGAGASILIDGRDAVVDVRLETVS
jgi:anaerobic selenocysteine-containing dehydrogenase